MQERRKISTKAYFLTKILRHHTVYALMGLSMARTGFGEYTQWNIFSEDIILVNDFLKFDMDLFLEKETNLVF